MSILKSTFLWLYIACIVLFAIIYTVIWSYKPDSFIVNTELNVYPFHETMLFLWEDQKNIDNNNTDYELKKIYSEFLPYIQKINNSENALKLKNERLIEIKKESNELNIIGDQEIQETKQRLGKENVDPIRVEKLELDTKVQFLISQISKKNNLLEIYEIDQQLKETFKLREEINQKLYKTEMNNINQFLENPRSFRSEKVNHKLNELYAEEQNIDRDKINLIQDIRNNRQKLSEEFQKYYTQRKAKLGIIDFLYFSVGIATTTTFGDIIGNTKGIRALITLELIICLVLLTGLLNSIFKPNNQTTSP